MTGLNDYLSDFRTTPRSPAYLKQGLEQLFWGSEVDTKKPSVGIYNNH